MDALACPGCGNRVPDPDTALCDECGVTRPTLGWTQTRLDYRGKPYHVGGLTPAQFASSKTECSSCGKQVIPTAEGLCPQCNQQAQPAKEKIAVNDFPPIAPTTDEATLMMLEASKKGDLVTVEKSLDEGAEIDGGNSSGRTSLMLAAEHGKLNIMEALLRAGANVNAVDQHGDCAWTLAASKPNYVAVVHVLEKHGARVTAEQREHAATARAATRGKLAEKRKSFLRLLFDWRMDAAELEKQLKSYDTLGLHSYRKISALLLLLSVAMNAVFGVWLFGLATGVIISNAVVYSTLAFFVYRGHRWALLGAMILWTFDKGAAVYESPRMVAGQAIWWLIYMSAFWKAFRVERERRKQVT